MADSEPQVGEATASRPRSGPGRLLRDQRLRRELSVGDVADGLHLDARTIDGLERDDYAGLPPVTFVRGYLRAYARLLELPEEEVLKRFDALRGADGARPLTPSVGDAGTAPAPTPAVRRRRGGGLLTVSLALVLFIGGVGGGAWLLQQRDWSLSGLERLLGGDPVTESADDGSLALAPASEPSADAAGGQTSDADADDSADTSPDTGSSVDAADETVQSTSGDGDPAADAGGGVSGRAAERPVFDPELVESPATDDAGDGQASAELRRRAVGESAPAPEASADDGAAEPATTPAPDASAAQADAAGEPPPVEARPPSRDANRPNEDQADPAPGRDALLSGEADADGTAAGDDAGIPDGTGGGGGTAASEAEQTLRFSFSGESWMEVRDARGDRLLFGLEEDGVRVVAGVPPFEIVVGDTQNVTLEREGEAVPLEQYARDRVARFTLGSP